MFVGAVNGDAFLWLKTKAGLFNNGRRYVWNRVSERQRVVGVRVYVRV